MDAAGGLVGLGGVAPRRRWRMPDEVVQWSRRSRRWLGRSLRRKVVGYLVALTAVAAVTVAIGALPTGLTLAHPSPLYLTAVLASGALYGRGPAVVAAVLSFLAFDWFFVAPVHTLTVADPDEWAAVLLFLLAAVVTGQLTATLRHRADDASRRAREARLLHEIGTTLVSGGSLAETLGLATARLRETLTLAACDVLVPDGEPSREDGTRENGRVRLVSLLGTPISWDDAATAQWVFDEGKIAWRGWARGTHRLVRLHRRQSSATPRTADVTQPLIAPAQARSRETRTSFLPLTVEGRPVGVLFAAVGAERHELGDEESRVLAAIADLFALAVERRRLLDERVQAEVLRRTDAVRAALLAAVSHDLRTPLAAITAAAGSLLQEGVEWDERSRRDIAAQVEREARRLDRLVSNLLDLSRIEAGALKLDRQWYPLAALVDDSIDRLGHALTAHHVVNAVPDDLPPVSLDYVLIQQVLMNLLENAAKYAPSGSKIRVMAEPIDQRVRVRVEDEGPGIPRAERERVFHSFYRVVDERSAAPDRRVRGKGLGLAVAAGFVAAHGGRIWVEDSTAAPGHGAGAAFVFDLPLESPPLAAERHPPIAEPEPVRPLARTASVYRPRRARQRVAS